MITLNYIDRKDVGNSDSLRESGSMPAVFYGKKQTSTPITVLRSEFIKVWKTAGESGVVSLVGPNGNIDALIQEVDRDPVTEIPRHADFYVFEKGKKIEVSIPLVFVGVSPAVKDMSGNLVKVMHEIDIEASPENLPHEISVDISSLLDFDAQILAKDVVLPSGVSLACDGEEVVASVSAPKAEELDEPTVAPDLSAIEVEKKGKKDDEEGESTE
ncbi:MAG: 50S ribosomal protein L25 [Minisyncoccota bacterium]